MIKINIVCPSFTAEGNNDDGTGDWRLSGMLGSENTDDEGENDDIVNDDNWHRQQPAKIQHISAQRTSTTMHKHHIT